LYEHGASHAILGGKWGSALGSALSGACHTLVHQFVERHGVDVNQVCGKYGPAIHMLIKERAYDEEELVQLFLNSGADVDALGGQYGTPLAASIVKGEPGLFEDLLKRGADPNRWWEKSGLSPLWLACQTDRLDYAQQLIAHGADINFCLPRRGTPLQGATISGNKAIIQMLLDAGAYVNELTPGMYGTALNAAVYSDNREIVEYLLSHDADITLLGGAYHSILQVAALKASIPLLRYLLTKGASVNEIGGRHRTALQAACSAGRGKIAKILLMNGADPNIAGGVHGTALQAACANGKLSLVRLLLAYGADPKIKGGKYGSALIAAVLRGNPQVVKVLLAEEGITVDMLGEKRRHFSTKRWNTTKDVIKAALTNTKPLEAFNIDSIKLPGEEEELLKAEETVELVTDEPVSPETVDTETPQSPIGSSSEEGSDTVFVQRTDSMVAAAAEAIVQSVLPEQSKITNFVTVVEGEEKMEDMSALSWVQVRCGKGGDLDGEGW
jgi:ankyrin repeat protein